MLQLQGVGRRPHTFHQSKKLEFPRISWAVLLEAWGPETWTSPRPMPPLHKQNKSFRKSRNNVAVAKPTQNNKKSELMLMRRARAYTAVSARR